MSVSGLGGLASTRSFTSPQLTSDHGSDSEQSSDEEFPFPNAPPNRYEIKWLLQGCKLLSAEAKAAKMSIMDYVMGKINGQNLAVRPDQANYNPEVGGLLTNFSRLFERARALIRPLTLAQLDPAQLAHQFVLASPEALLNANLAIGNMLEEQILAEIGTNPRYTSFFNQVQAADFREIDGIPNAKIITALETCGFIDQNCRLIQGALLNKASITALQTSIPDPKTCKQILEVLHCIALKSDRKMIRLRLTKSTFLDPRVLSEMSHGQLSIPEARLLLTCLGLKENNKTTPVCVLTTGEYPQDLAGKLQKSTPPSLCLIDPNNRKEPLPEKIDEEKTFETVQYLSEGTKLIATTALGQLEKIIAPLDHQMKKKIVDDITIRTADHVDLRNFLFEPNELEQFIKTNSTADKWPQIESCFAELRKALNQSFVIADSCVAKIPDRKDTLNHCLALEAETRLKDSIAAYPAIQGKFEEFKHILRHFLLFSIQTFELKKAYQYTICWEMDGIKVQENLTLEKSCAVLRRLHFPARYANDRTDLPYFAEAPDDSVANRWKGICENYYLSDKELAEKALSLYTTGTLDKDEAVELKQFLVPLVILLMGKEPSLDSASLIANFILLYSVKLGIRSFNDALRAMPMIPQGAVSAKQFLLHVSGLPLDALSGVQYKKSDNILRSYFLPTLTSFVGTADDWTQKYDDVATIAVECCQMLFISPIKKWCTPSVLTLKRGLEMLANRALTKWELIRALDCADIERKIAAMEQICIAYITKNGKAHLLPNDESKPLKAINLCRAELAAALPDKYTQISGLLNPFNELFETKFTIVKLLEHLDPTLPRELIENKKALANEYLISIGEPDELATAIQRCRAILTPGIDSSDPRIQELRTLLERFYKRPIAYWELAESINYEGFEDNEDEIGSWVIDYIANLHPLST